MLDARGHRGLNRRSVLGSVVLDRRLDRGLVARRDVVHGTDLVGPRQRLLDDVDDPTPEVRGGAGNLCQPLALLERFGSSDLGAQARGDVTCVDEAGGAAIEVQAPGRNLDMHDFPALSPVPPESPRLLTVTRAREHREEGRHVLHRPQVLDRHAEEFGAAVAVVGHRGVVHRQVAERLPIVDEQGIHDAVEQVLIPVLAPPQRCLVHPPLGQIAHNFHKAPRPAVAVAQSRDDTVAPEERPVLAAAPGVERLLRCQRRLQFFPGGASGDVLCAEQDAVLLADGFLHGVAMEARRAFIPGLDETVWVQRVDGVVRHGRDQELEARLQPRALSPLESPSTANPALASSPSSQRAGNARAAEPVLDRCMPLPVASDPPRRKRARRPTMRRFVTDVRSRAHCS